MNTMMKKSNLNKYTMDHQTVNYVDDSYHCIEVKKAEDLKEYLKDFLTVISTYFSANKLALNKDNTGLMIHCHPRYHHIIRDISIHNDKHEDDTAWCEKSISFQLFLHNLFGD